MSQVPAEQPTTLSSSTDEIVKLIRSSINTVANETIRHVEEEAAAFAAANRTNSEIVSKWRALAAQRAAEARSDAEVESRWSRMASPPRARIVDGPTRAAPLYSVYMAPQSTSFRAEDSSRLVVSAPPAAPAPAPVSAPVSAHHTPLEDLCEENARLLSIIKMQEEELRAARARIHELEASESNLRAGFLDLTDAYRDAVSQLRAP